MNNYKKKAKHTKSKVKKNLYCVWLIICQERKKADNLKNKALWNSCSFKNIVNRVCTVGISRGQSDLWSFGPSVRFCPLFCCVKGGL